MNNEKIIKGRIALSIFSGDPILIAEPESTQWETSWGLMMEIVKMIADEKNKSILQQLIEISRGGDGFNSKYEFFEDLVNYITKNYEFLPKEEWTTI